MIKNQMLRIVLIAALLAMSSLITGCATSGSSGDAGGISPNIVYNVADSAQISKISYFFKEYKGAERLHMEIAVKNISNQTKRFRVNIFLPEGPSGGGLYPRKVKGDVKGIDAGKEHTRVFPMYYDKLPSGFMIVVKELG